MSWKITQISNGTNTVTLTNEKGEKLSVVIPAEHRVSRQTKADFIKSQTDAFEAKAAGIVPPAVNVIPFPSKFKVNMILLGIAIAEFVVIAGMLIKGH
jgi:hypothetical protein